MKALIKVSMFIAAVVTTTAAVVYTKDVLQRRRYQKAIDAFANEMEGHINTFVDELKSSLGTLDETPSSEVAVEKTSNDYIAALTKLYEDVDTVDVPFDPAWGNGTDYFDNAVRCDLKMPAGQIARSMDLSDRRLVFIPLENTVTENVGNLPVRTARYHVYFDRYSPQSETNLVVMNGPFRCNRDEAMQLLLDKAA